MQILKKPITLLKEQLHGFEGRFSRLALLTLLLVLPFLLSCSSRPLKHIIKMKEMDHRLQNFQGELCYQEGMTWEVERNEVWISFSNCDVVQIKRLKEEPR